MTKVTDPLIDPGVDLYAQVGVLAGLLDEAPIHVAALPALREWWVAWRELVSVARAEVALGIAEGLDDSRRDFLGLAEDIARTASNILLRSRPLLPIVDALTVGAACAHHTHATWALRGARQGLFWVVATEISGTLPRFRLLGPGADIVAAGRLDPLGRALTKTEAVDMLNRLARGMLWR